MMLIQKQHENICYYFKQKQQNDQQSWVIKIKKRFKQTQINNKRKDFYDRFILRNCRMDYLPLRACQWLSDKPQLRRIKQLNLSQMNLRYLKYLPQFPTLVKLDLTMNFITGDQIIFIVKFTKLELLYLTQNFISNLEAIKPLSALTSLKQIDLSSNPVKYDRAFIFNTIRNLKIVDRYTANGNDLQRSGLFYDGEQDEQMQEEQSEQGSQDNDQYYDQYEQKEQSNIVYESDIDDFMEQDIMQIKYQKQDKQDKQGQQYNQEQQSQQMEQQNSEQQSQNQHSDSEMVEQKSQVKIKKQKKVIQNKQQWKSKQFQKGMTYEEAEKRLKQILDSIR